MRIVGGTHRGRRIKSPRGRFTRPTPDIVREALFNILSRKVVQCRFLDIFAGTGAVGIEALSRGANFAVFIEQDRSACKLILENLKNLNLLSKAEVLCFDAMENMKKMEKKDESFDIIFLDPPYYKDMIAPSLEYLKCSRILKPDSVVVIQHAWDISIEHNGFANIKQKRYGKTTLSFLMKEEKL